MSNRVGLTIIACSLGVVFFVACRSALNSLENDEPNVLAGFEYDPNDNRYLEATIGSTCKEVAVNWQNVHLSGPMKHKTRKPSEKLLPDFSLYGRVAVYPDNKMETLRTDRLFWDDIDIRIGLSRREALAKNDHGGFGEAAFEAFDQYRHYINGKRGGVINAPTSWVEAAAFQHGAASMMSIGYRQVEIQSANNLTFMHPLDICKQQRDTVNSLDFAAAFTTIERSGLGRFNEALDPWGDLRMMAMVRCLLKFDGIFVLGVPLGEDALFWNSHRTYGSLRLSWLVRGYKLLGSLLYFAGVSFAIEDVWLGLQVRSMKETGIGLEFCKIPKTGSTIVGNILCDVIREYHGITYAQNISDTLDGELLLRKCQGRDIHEFAEKVHDALMHRISFVNRDPDIKLHVLPQADFCDLGSNLEQYEVIYWSEDRLKMKKQFEGLFEKAGVPKEIVAKVLRHLTESSTSHAQRDNDRKSRIA
ncbi:unnamed protein product, partial [Mesorhabditis spiculigera]